jgi:hypothetical protein
MANFIFIYSLVLREIYSLHASLQGRHIYHINFDYFIHEVFVEYLN